MLAKCELAASVRFVVTVQLACEVSKTEALLLELAAARSTLQSSTLAIRQSNFADSLQNRYFDQYSPRTKACCGCAPIETPEPGVNVSVDGQDIVRWSRYMHLSFGASLARFHCRGSLLQLYRHTELCLSHRRWHTAKITSCTHVSVRGTVAKAVDHSSSDQQPQPLTAWHHKPKVSHLCPACGQQIQRLPVLERHFQKCCPDLISWQVKIDTGQDYTQPCNHHAAQKQTECV